MLSVQQAVEIIQNKIPKWNKTKITSSVNTLNFILAEPVNARRDIPQKDNSAMDGFVLRKEDWDAGQRSFPVAFEVRPEFEVLQNIPDGKCARIMTGAPVPANGNQVIPVELSNEVGGVVTFSSLPNKNPIRRKGEGYTQGKTVLEKGSLIRPYEMGLLIESGNRECEVVEPIRVGVQVTGSEVDEDMNTNGPVLREIIKTWPGVVVKEWPVLQDNPEEVKNRLLALKRDSDVIVTTGGISAGRHDYLFSTMQNFGADVLVRKVNLKPGKPFTLSLWDDVPVCNLPGNPFSAVFCAEMFLRRIIATMLGRQIRDYQAIADKTLKNPGSRALFIPGFAHIKNGRLHVQADTVMKSHLLQLYIGNNVYVHIPPESGYQSGEEVDIIPFSNQSLPWL